MSKFNENNNLKISLKDVSLALGLLSSALAIIDFFWSKKEVEGENIKNINRK